MQQPASIQPGLTAVSPCGLLQSAGLIRLSFVLLPPGNNRACSARIVDLRCHRLGVSGRMVFLNDLRSGFDEIFGFLKPRTCRFPNGLDDADLVFAT